MVLMFTGLVLLSTSGRLSAQAMDAAGQEIWLRPEPLVIYTEVIGKTKRMRVDWGTIDEVITRNPNRVAEDLEALRAEWTSPERIALLKKEWERLIPIEEEIGREAFKEYKRLREEVRQTVNVSRQIEITKDTHDAPGWLLNLPWEIRRTLRLAVFDANDSQQVAWALRIRQTYPEVELIAVGWPSHKFLDELVEQHPSLRHQRVQTVFHGEQSRRAEDWLEDYGIHSLPTLINFPTSTTITLVKGIGDVQHRP